MAIAQKPHGKQLHAQAVEKTAGRDARQLLWAGACFLVAGIVAVILTKTIFGGIGRHGPHTNGGWLLLVLAMACVPLGIMLTVLGGAKWLGTRRNS